MEKPILSLHPPWTTIFKGERVILRCDGYQPLLLEPRPINTLWYLGHQLLPSHKKTIEVQTPGIYRCQTRGAPVSDPIHLSMSNDWLILQVPYAMVFEGEPLVIRCRGWYDKVIYKLHYYKDGHVMRYFHSSANYTIPQARASDSGQYQCSGTLRIPVESTPMFSAKVVVTIQELFASPVLKVVPKPDSRSGGGVTLHCETRLHPQKRDTPLQFSFYKYSRPVRRFDWGSEYTVPETETEDLESYWCESATVTRSVRKRSPWLQLAGRGSFSSTSSITTRAPQPAAMSRNPVSKPLSFRKPPEPRLVPSGTSTPNSTLTRALASVPSIPTAGPTACSPLTSLEQSASPSKPNMDLLLQEMQQLKSLLRQVMLELKEPHKVLGLKGIPKTPALDVGVSLVTPQITGRD
ncbi:Fc receptor-like B [Monodelphis domestica]|nr:Fc receptor-like B [Monodelphis domestica]